MHAFLLLPLLATSGATAEAPGEELAGRDLEVVAGEARLRSFQALAALDAEQSEALATLASRVAVERDRYLERRRSVLAIQEVSFEAFRQEDLDGGEFDPPTERNTGVADRMGREERNEFVASLRPYDELAAEVLNPGQLLLLEYLEPERFVHCALGAKARAPGEPLLRQAWGAVDAVAGKKGKSLAREARAQAMKILGVAARQGTPAYDADLERARIAALLERAAYLSDDARERCICVFAHELLPRDDEAYARAGLRRIHEEKYREASTLMRLLLVADAADILRGDEGADASPAAHEVRRLETEVESLRAQISLLNLLNGLHLTREQLGALAAIGARATEERPRSEAVTPSVFASLGFRPAPYEPTKKDGGRKRLAAEMEKLRTELRRGRLPASKGVKSVESVAGYHARGSSNLPLEKRNGFAAEVLEVLTPAQEQVLHDFNNCLIPPHDLRNPVRVGQAANHEHERQELERVREIPEERYARLREKIGADTLAKIERHTGAWPPSERGKVLEELLALFDEVRTLDDVTFALRTDEMVERLQSLELKHRLQDRIVTERQKRLTQRAVQFLLDPHVTALAREVVVRRDGRGLPDPVDLETIMPAPSCKDGKCAVD